MFLSRIEWAFSCGFTFLVPMLSHSAIFNGLLGHAEFCVAMFPSFHSSSVSLNFIPISNCSTPIHTRSFAVLFILLADLVQTMLDPRLKS